MYGVMRVGMKVFVFKAVLERGHLAVGWVQNDAYRGCQPWSRLGLQAQEWSSHVFHLPIIIEQTLTKYKALKQQWSF